MDCLTLMSAMEKLQAVHDQMLAAMPSGSTHLKEECPFCSGGFAALVEGGTVSDKTYTDDEVKAQIAAAVATATADAQVKIAVLEAAEEAAKKNPFAKDDEDDEDDKAKAEAAAEIAELTAKLDAAVLEATAAKAERDEITAWLEAEAASLVLEAETATRKADRIAKVAEVVTFPEAYVTERADNWAALEDVQFEALLADYQALGIKTPTPGPEPLPRVTAMQASRETDESTVVGSAVKDLIRGRNFGVDPRAIR